MAKSQKYETNLQTADFYQHACIVGLDRPNQV